MCAALHSLSPASPPSPPLSLLQVVITFYVEDGSLAITEPPVLNSGLPQSKVLRRHQVPRAALGEGGSVLTVPGGRHSDFVTWKDLR